ncbi:MAG: radical SAM protein [Nanoarchaeota archaeon]
MKKKILLIQAPFWSTATTSLGLAYLISNVKSDSRKVEQLHLDLELFQDKELYNKIRYYTDSQHKVIDDLKFLYPKDFGVVENDNYKIITKLVNSWCEKIILSKSDIIGFSVNSGSRLFSLLIAQKIKRINKDMLIVFGGPECRLEESGNFIIKTGFVDAIVIGEGENTFEELITQIEEKNRLQECPGAIIRYNNNTLSNYERRKLKSNLDEFKFPEFKTEDLDKSEFPFMIPMIMSRGCIGNCKFCLEKLYWQCFRSRSVNNIISEIKEQKRLHDIKSIRFNDSLINGNMNILNSFCDRMIEEQLNVTWSGNARFDKGLTHEFLKKMFDAGCRKLMFGMESGSNKVLESMNKQIDIKTCETILENVKQVGIWGCVYFIVGFPSEEPKDFLETIIFLARNHDKIVDFSISGLNIKQNSYIFKNQKEFNIEIETPKIIECDKYPFVKYLNMKLEQSNNQNFNDAKRRNKIICEIFDNYKTVKNETEKFLENKEIQESKKSILKRYFIFEDFYYSKKGTKKINRIKKIAELKKNEINYLQISIDEIKKSDNFRIKLSNVKLLLKILLKESELTIENGYYIIKFLEELKKQKIKFRLTKPLPKCLFKNEAIKNEYNIPKDCSKCLEFIKLENNELIYCEKNTISKLNQAKKLKNCVNCIYKIRNDCGEFCL